jgi:hypothetical protein
MQRLSRNCHRRETLARSVVFGSMGVHAAFAAHTPPGGMIVRRPQPSDATGASLRKAFEGPAGMSSDLLRLVRALEKVD